MQYIYLSLSLLLFVSSSFGSTPSVANEYSRGKALFQAGKLDEARQVWQGLLDKRSADLNAAQVKALQGRVGQVDSMLPSPIKRARQAYNQGRKLGGHRAIPYFKKAEQLARKTLQKKKRDPEASFIAASSILRQKPKGKARIKEAYMLGRNAVETEPGRTDELLEQMPEGEMKNALDDYALKIRIENSKSKKIGNQDVGKHNVMQRYRPGRSSGGGIKWKASN